MTHIVKNTTRTALTLVLVFSILFQSLYFKPEKVEANPGAAAIAGYIMSIVGAVDMGTGGGVRGIATSLKDSLTQKVADLMGSGIYEDSNGNLVFSGSATQQIYETLLGSSAYDTVAISQFPISDTFTPPNVYGGAQFWGQINDYIANLGSGASYLELYGKPLVGSNGYTYLTHTVYDTSNVAFYKANYDAGWYLDFYFYDKNGNSVTCPYKRFIAVTKNSDGSLYNIYNKTGSNSGSASYYTRNITNYGDVQNGSYNINQSLNSIDSLDNMVLSFNYGCIYSRSSIILTKSVNSGISFFNKNTGVTVNNTYNTIPSVKSTVVENNDWTNIYNNYVQNVQNQSETYITNGTIDTSKLRKIMKQYGQAIIDSVEQGVENIIEYVSVTNEWLNRIYQLLSEINQKLEDGGGSGGTVSGSTVDLSNIESYLQSLNTSVSAMQTQVNYIANNLPNNEQQLTQIYTILQNIYQSLQNIPSGGSPNDPNSDPYAPWYPKFFGIPDTDIIDTVEKIQIIEALLSGLVPLCYITGIGAVVNALSAEPVEPVFTIPVQFDNTFYSVDEELEIDLTAFDDMRDVVTGGIILVFMLSLGYFTIILLKFLLDIMSKA